MLPGALIGYRALIRIFTAACIRPHPLGEGEGKKIQFIPLRPGATVGSSKSYPKHALIHPHPELVSVATKNVVTLFCQLTGVASPLSWDSGRAEPSRAEPSQAAELNWNEPANVKSKWRQMLQEEERAMLATVSGIPR